MPVRTWPAVDMSKAMPMTQNHTAPQKTGLTQVEYINSANDRRMCKERLSTRGYQYCGLVNYARARLYYCHAPVAALGVSIENSVGPSVGRLIRNLEELT